MTLSAVPDLGSRRRLVLAAVVVSLAAIAILVSRGTARLASGFGDTDDALRLVMMRNLAGGGGWFDQAIARLQPPYGVYMHWSRLIDAGLAALDGLFGLVLSPSAAEMATRIVWPLLWIFPAVLGALLVARRLGGGMAVLIAGVWLTANSNLFHQFSPGRIDHHNAQIALCLLAYGAAARTLGQGGLEPPSNHVATAALAGAATALGLAIGLEALPYAALIGAALGLAWVADRIFGRTLAAYGVALGSGALALYAVQTPPWRWSLSVCDALAVNLVVALVFTGAGLALIARVGRGKGAGTRFALLALCGLAASVLYLGLDPACLHGPLGAVTPLLKTAWLDNVQEMAPWPRLFKSDRSDAIQYALVAVLGLGGWLWIGRSRLARTDPVWMLSGILLIAAAAMTFQAARTESYLQWFAAPLIAAALVDVGGRLWRDRLVPALAATAALALVPAAVIARTAAPVVSPASKAASIAGAACTVAPAFHRLAALPPGLVLGEIDAGPYILATTRHSVVAAPYHRMGWGMTQALAAWRAPDAEAERRVRALGVAYVVDCPAHANLSDRTGAGPQSLMGRLDKGQSPEWLEPLSGPTEALKVYRVLPLLR